MVGISNTPAAHSPVPHAHTLIHQPNATITSVLSSLPLPQHIPPIEQARPGEWAQCLAMVQDIWDAELFIASSPEGRSALFIENGAVSNHPQAKLAERLPVYLVSPPGHTRWARGGTAEQQSRQPNAGGVKRNRETDDVDMLEQGEIRPQSSGDSSTEKRRRSDGNVPAQEKSWQTLGLNLPVAGESGGNAVVAKIYDDAFAKQLRLHSLIHVIGIVQEGVQIEVEEGNMEFVEEFQARNPNNVKRLHVVKARQATEVDMYPAAAEIERWRAGGDVVQMRNLIVGYLASGLGGDLIAAEYLLLGIIARPNVRVGGEALGKLCVNLVMGDGDIVGMLERICVGVVKIDVDIARLNAKEMYPKKDYELNRLRASPLQLGGGVVVMDERGLSDGRLAERGVKNVRALSRVAKGGVTPVDFGFYENEMAVSCGCVVVSKGKSIVETDVRVRCVEGGVGMKGWQDYEEGELEGMRRGIVGMMEGGGFDIEEETSKVVEEEFVRERRNGLKDGEESLQRWLAVARACARSFGEDKLSVQRWKYMRELERRRCERESSS